MPRVPIAHLREQGQDMIIVPLDHTFGHKTKEQQSSTIYEIQARSRAAGLKGTVVPVWHAGAGRMAFIAPKNWRAFFSSIDLDTVTANLNRELHW